MTSTEQGQPVPVYGCSATVEGDLRGGPEVPERAALTGKWPFLISLIHDKVTYRDE